MGLTVRFDYLQGTGYFPSYQDFDYFLNELCSFLPLGDSWSYLNHGIHLGETFTNTFKSVRGKFYGGTRETDKGYRYLLQLPGSYCSQLCSQDYLSTIKYLTENDFNFTRCDIMADDYTRRVSFSEVKRAGEEGNYKLVDSYKCIESSLTKGSPLVPTCYFGSSNKQLRFYDAETVHGLPADRWELQLRSDHARSVIDDYLKNSNQLGLFITGSVDFGEGTRTENFKRFPWWESLIQDLGGAKRIELAVFNPCFEKSLAWLFSQVAPTLAVARQGYGQIKFMQLVEQVVSEGTKRLKPYHQAWITELKKEQV